MRKIIIIVSLTFILFVLSLILQTKYSYMIFNRNIYDTENLFLKKVEVSDKTFIFTDLFILSIVVCSFVMIFILIFILLNRRRMEFREKLKNKLLVDYQELILNALHNSLNEGHIDEESIKKFSKIINTKFRRQILINQIIDISLNLPENQFLKIKNLYYDLGLINDTLNKVHSGKWNIIIKGIKELSYMKVREYNQDIIKYINSDNPILKIEAKIALVHLADKTDGSSFDFLSELEEPLSLWEQITLHQLIIQNDIKPPDFGKWVLLENDSVVKFCLRMIKEFKQIQNEERIDYLMFHNNDNIRKLTIQVIGDLKLKESLSLLKNRYKHETYDNSVEIIKSIGKLSNPKSIGFLQKVIDIQDDVQLQIEAAKAINNMGDIGKEALNKMLSSDYKNYNIIIRHVLDNRIN